MRGSHGFSLVFALAQMTHRRPAAATIRPPYTPAMAGDVLIIGGGSTGEAFAGALRGFEPDVPVKLVERELVGGECSYYACMPSKALLRPPEVVAAARLAPGAAEAISCPMDARRVFWHRDQLTGGWD